MGVEFLLTAITLLVAIIGTGLKDPPRKVKAFLIALAILASIGSAIKAINNDSDKAFMQTALVANLNPSNSSYEKICDDIHEAGKTLGFTKDTACYHGSDGTIAFLAGDTGAQRATAVFNRSDIAEIYGHQLRKSSNRKFILSVLDKTYVPKDLGGELLDKVGILAFGIYFTIVGEFPIHYHYDQDFGVRVAFETAGGRKILEFSAADIAKFREDKSLKLFYLLEQDLRARFAAMQVQRK